MPTLKKYFIRKIAFFVITFFVATSISFFVPRLMPGDVVTLQLNRMEQMSGGSEQAAALRRQFGLDRPIYEQFFAYYVNVFQGNLGVSLAYYPEPVIEIIMLRLPWTIGLMGTTAILSWVIGNLLGLFSGWKRGSKLSSVTTVVALGLNQIPYYVMGIVLMYLFVYTFHLLPASGGYDYLITSSLTFRFMSSVLLHALLPSLSIILVGFGYWTLTTRALITNILESDYLRFAEVKGLKRNVILMKYAFRNALLPQVTGLGMSLGRVMNGSLLIEILFTYPGLGLAFYSAIQERDYTLMQGILFISIATILIANLIVDLIYPLIDPRIREVEG